MSRPFTVTLLAILAGLAGIWAIVDVLRFLGIMPIATLGEIRFYGASFIGAVFAFIVALIWFWAASKLWNLDPQGWSFVVVIAIVYLIFDFVAILAGSSWQSVSVSVILSGIALILGLLPSTRAAFGQR
jgi:hypothetical protein